MIKAIFIALASTGYCAWAPFGLISDSLIPKEHEQLLYDGSFIGLKSQVKSYLAKSWCSEEKIELLMDLMVLEQPVNCVEIGVFSGSSLLPVATTLKFLGRGKVVGIEPWSNSEVVKAMSKNEPQKKWWSEVDMQRVFSECMVMIKQWDLYSYWKIIKSTSENAVQKMGEIDFLHIDGSFMSDSALSDAKLYLPKVKMGGCILASNMLIWINDDYQKVDFYDYLVGCCEIITEIDQGNAILFRKVL